MLWSSIWALQILLHLELPPQWSSLLPLQVVQPQGAHGTTRNLAAPPTPYFMQIWWQWTLIAKGQPGTNFHVGMNKVIVD